MTRPNPSPLTVHRLEAVTRRGAAIASSRIHGAKRSALGTRRHHDDLRASRLLRIARDRQPDVGFLWHLQVVPTVMFRVKDQKAVDPND